MNLHKIANLYWQRMVCVKISDGSLITGQLVSYTSAGDNDPDPESIIIRVSSGMLIELFDHEVENVILISKC